MKGKIYVLSKKEWTIDHDRSLGDMISDYNKKTKAAEDEVKKAQKALEDLRISRTKETALKKQETYDIYVHNTKEAARHNDLEFGGVRK